MGRASWSPRRLGRWEHFGCESLAVGRWGEGPPVRYGELNSSPPARTQVWVNQHREGGLPYDVRVDGEQSVFVEVKTSLARDKTFFEMSYRE